jgi:hypothetical protein
MRRILSLRGRAKDFIFSRIEEINNQIVHFLAALAAFLGAT